MKFWELSWVQDTDLAPDKKCLCPGWQLLTSLKYNSLLFNLLTLNCSFCKRMAGDESLSDEADIKTSVVSTILLLCLRSEEIFELN